MAAAKGISIDAAMEAALISAVLDFHIEDSSAAETAQLVLIGLL